MTVFSTQPYATEPFSTLEEAEARILTVRYSNTGYTSKSTDSPASTYFPARLLQPAKYSCTILSGDEPFGLSEQSLGSIVLDNSDGLFDALVENHAIDGRTLRLYLGNPEDAFADFNRILDILSEGWRLNGDELEITPRNLEIKLKNTLQTEFYAGTGGAEGAAEFANTPKPICLGFRREITPIYLGILNFGDGALQTYQGHHTTIQGFTMVREGGIAYVETSGVPGVGEFKQYKTGTNAGIFQIGSTTDQFAITCDLQGDATGTGYSAEIGTIIRRLLKNYGAEMADSEINFAALQDLTNAIPGTAGVYITDIRAVADVLHELLLGCGAHSCSGIRDRMRMMAFQVPSTDPNLVTQTIYSWDIISAPELFGPNDLPENVSYPNSRRSVGWKQNNSPQNNTFAAGIDDDYRKFVAKEFRESAVVDQNTETRNLLARVPEMLRSPFDEESAANSIRDRLMTAFAGSFTFWRITARTNWQVVNIGDTIKIFHPRMGFVNGRLGRVVGMDMDIVSNIVIFTVFIP